MFEKLKSLFGGKKVEQKPSKKPAVVDRPIYVPRTTAVRAVAPSTPASRAQPVSRDDSTDLLNPLNPLGLTSPISPLNSRSHASTNDEGCGWRPSSYDSGSYSSDSGSSSSSCDSGSSSSGSCGGCD